MNRKPIVILVVLFSGLSFALGFILGTRTTKGHTKIDQQYQTTTDKHQDKTPAQSITWIDIQECIKDFKSIKPGMTRSEIKKMFPMDGGLQFPSPVRFLHPKCEHFMVDVDFAYKRNPDDGNRAVFGEDDKVTKISRPYLAWPAYD